MLLGVLAVPSTKLELGMVLVAGDQKKALQLIDEGFGEGITGPLMVIVDGDGSSDPRLAYNQLAQAIEAKDDVAAVAPPQPNADGSGAMIMVIPKSGPAGPETQELMHQIRDLKPSAGNGVQFGVAGQTAMISDLSEAHPGGNQQLTEHVRGIAADSEVFGDAREVVESRMPRGLRGRL